MNCKSNRSPSSSSWSITWNWDDHNEIDHWSDYQTYWGIFSEWYFASKEVLIYPVVFLVDEIDSVTCRVRIFGILEDATSGLDDPFDLFTLRTIATGEYHRLKSGPCEEAQQGHFGDFKRFVLKSWNKIFNHNSKIFLWRSEYDYMYSTYYQFFNTKSTSPCLNRLNFCASIEFVFIHANLLKEFN